MAKITLDAETFRALASSTRLTVLKALDERRKTLTELARDLNLNKATVHEHMALLTAAGLVRKRDDEGRKWIYYELTWTGQRILRPEATTTFNLLLGLSVAAAGGGVYMLGHALGWWFAAHHVSPQAEGVQLGTVQDNDKSAAAPAAGGGASGSSTATYSTAAGSQSSAPQGAGAAAATTTTGSTAQDSAPLDPGHAATAHHSYFFDDGGWIAVALLVTCALFVALAWVMLRKMRPKPFDANAAAAAEMNQSR